MNFIYFIAGCLFWGSIIFVLFLFRYKSWLHSETIENMGCRQKILLLSAAGFVVLACILPMGVSPSWNGELPDHRNQYEVMAEAVLNGHFYMDYDDVDPRLLEMDNPYDPEERTRLGVNFHWDHAFYDGHYYMYFGVVPVFLLFLPYRIVTGMSLMTYHATQIFAGMFIAGIFVLFHFLIKKFFCRLTFGMYLALSSAFAVMSIWYSIAAPSLYCTAITSGLCMEVWSLYFFAKSVWGEAGQVSRKSIFYAFLGSLFGALAFGCRPPVALANIAVIPMLAEYLKNKKMDFRLFGQLTAAALPYVVIGILLMAYNYVRFDSPFEFGQTYQLTLADQSSYGNFFDQFDLVNVLNGVVSNLISFSPVKKEFPYISLNGALVNFPILCSAAVSMAQEGVREQLKKLNIRNLTIVFFMLPFVITMTDVLWSPFIGERYRMDIYWIMGVTSFIFIGICYIQKPETSKRKFSFVMTNWALITIFTCMLLYCVPNDLNFTEPFFLENVERIKKILALGFV